MKQDVNEVFHAPVLLTEVIFYLRVEARAWYIDATAGGGGHTQAILEKGGNVFAIDQDEDAIKKLKGNFKKELDSGKLLVKHGNFANLTSYIKESKIQNILGVIFDLGLSTYQIKSSGRGFSFKSKEPLDMRMDQKQERKATQIVNNFSVGELYEIFRKFGEEKLARQIADSISRARSLSPIHDTSSLREIVAQVYKNHGVREKIDPATRVFQALRIAVNDELARLKQALPQAVEVLGKEGRCLVISFHSLEDRIVKQFILERERLGKIRRVTKKPIVAARVELIRNPKARSAKLRVFEKLN